jgi:hypothetical protein
MTAAGSTHCLCARNYYVKTPCDAASHAFNGLVVAWQARLISHSWILQAWGLLP